MYNRLILVTGAGTSGTSLLTGIFKALGCHIPQPETGSDTAPKGFGEPQWVVGLHTKLLRRASVQIADARPSAWAKTAAAGREPDVQAKLENWLQAQFKNEDHAVIKDPRLLWFIPAWRRAGETVATPCFVTVLRHPLDVINSFETGYGDRWNPNARTAGWINTMLYTERATRGDRRAVVRHDDLVGDAMLTVSRLSEELDLSFIERPMPNQMRIATSLTEPATSRDRATWASLEVDQRLVELAEATFKTLDQAGGDGQLNDKAVESELDALRQRYVDLYRFVESTAQFSISAGREVVGGPPPKPALSTETVRSALGRAKRKGLRTVYKLRPRQRT